MEAAKLIASCIKCYLFIMMLMDLYGCSTVEISTVKVNCTDVKENENFKYSVKGYVKLTEASITEENWYEGDISIAYYYYNPIVKQFSNDTVKDIGPGYIILRNCQNVNYTIFNGKEHRIYFIAFDPGNQDESQISHTYWIIVVLIALWIAGCFIWICRRRSVKLETTDTTDEASMDLQGR